MKDISATAAAANRSAAATKAAVTRRANKLAKRRLASAAWKHRNDVFDSLSDEKQQDVMDRVEKMLGTYKDALAAAESKLLDEVLFKFDLLVSEYGYDAVKSYTEGIGNGYMRFEGFRLDLNDVAENYGDKSTFVPEAAKAAVAE